MRPLAWVAAILCLAATPWSVGGAEPAQAFLEALRDRGYFDVALDYLDSAAKNSALPASFKETILYEKGTTLVQSARLQRDSVVREQQLDEAQKVLQQFLQDQPANLYAMGARSQLGNVIVERARNRVEKAKRLPPAEKQTVDKQARELYDQGGKVFAALVEELRTKLKNYPAALDDKQDAKRIEERDRSRQDFLQAQLLAAAAKEETADTLARDSKEWTQTLTAAADAYKKIYEDYRTRIAGLYARMYQARCYQKIGKHKDATAFFNELLSNPDSPDAFRTLKLKVMALAVESWAAQQLYPEIIDRPVKMIDAARASEERTDEMLGIRLAVARACKAYADQLKAKNPRDTQIRKLLADGRKYVTYVTRFPGEHQEAARRLMPEFGASDAEPAARPDPKTFVEAKDAAKSAIDSMQTANLLIKTLPSRIAITKSPEQDELQKQLAEAKQNADQSQADAARYCRLALKLADGETDLTDLNLIRYLSCYLLYGEKQYYDAIVIGDFLARHYPESQGARQCAKIVLASFVNLYSENTSEDKDFEVQRLIATADYIVQKWPDQPEADEALNTLIPFMIRAKKLQQAQEYLAKIPTDSPQRGTAELKTGQALWTSYSESAKQVRDWENGVQPLPEGADIATQKRELESLKAKARQTLVDGVERMRKSGETSKVLATSMLWLAQIYVDTNDAAKAVELLEDSKIGVLTLVEKKDPAVAGIPEETYKTALRAYISSLAGQDNPAATIEKARGVMDALKAHLATSAEGQQTLVKIYFDLARDLQRQMEIADPAAKKSLGVGFETFLKEVAADATELNVMSWVGDTYRGMGESFGASLKSLTPEAKGYFTKAAQTYQKILDKGQADPNFLPPLMATTIRIQLAKAKKSMGDYIAARDIFESILKASPTMLSAQIEAARLYQDWGGTGKGQEENYVRAIVGARPDKTKNGHNTLWGWGEIASRTANNPQYRDQFFDARYNLSLCRYNYALAQTTDAKRKDQLAAAKRDIAITAGLYPELGGEEKRKQFDNLLKNIQKSLGERTDGLRALTAPPAKSPPAAGKTTSVSTSAPVKSSPTKK
jgi:hypothetical protein